MVIARYVRADPGLRSLFIFRVFNSGTPLVGGVVFVGHQFLSLLVIRQLAVQSVSFSQLVSRLDRWFVI